jgi:hypothetical protein
MSCLKDPPNTNNFTKTYGLLITCVDGQIKQGKETQTKH